MVASRMPTAEPTSGGGVITPDYAVSTYINLADTIPAWDEWEVVNNQYGTNGSSWANYDIFNEDGSVYLAASDPIPIYE